MGKNSNGIDAIENNDHAFIFDQAIRTADILVKMWGSRCEVAVHDFHNLEQSLIYLAGTITDRKAGAPITDLVLRELKKPSSEIKDISNYKTISRKGLVMKSSTVFLRNHMGDVIGALCINIDISLFIQIGSEIQDFVAMEDPKPNVENFYSSVHEIIEEMVDRVLRSFNKVPTLLDTEEKIECVRQLEDKGAFLIKGCVEYVADSLGVSRYTIYNYLQKIRY